MKAMILAAGRGERFRPLTDSLPKPLIQVQGKPLIVRHLERLAEAGFKEVVINVSHLGNQIVSALGNGARWAIEIRYSHEDAPLETAGGIATARAELGEAPFVLVNADVYCNFPLRSLAKCQLPQDDLGHLVMVPNPPFRPGGDFSLVGDRVGKLAEPRYTYSGIAVLRPRIVDGISAGAKAALGPLLMREAEHACLGGELYSGVWNDVGTPERLADLERDLNHAVNQGTPS